MKPTLDDSADDALAEALADQLVEESRHNTVVRLVARQMAGLRRPTHEMTQDELATELGISRDQLNRIACQALRKLRLSPELSAFRRHL